MNGKEVVWSSNVSNLASNSRSKLLDTGNLVLLDDSTGNILWDSFQHPTYSFLPKMKLSINQTTRKKVQFTLWKSASDPSIENFSVRLERLSIPELFIWSKTKPYWRDGPWNVLGVYEMRPSYLYGFNIRREDDGTAYATFSFLNVCLPFLEARVICKALSIITSAEFIRDPETVSSNDNAFKLGFFSPQNSTNRYLGIWYLNESNVIWVANRNQPLRNSSGIFTISQDGNLVALNGDTLNGDKQLVWSSNVSNIASNSTAQLLDTGNLILQDLNT
ncbi:hypothetical protein L6164_036529 [Bauhinia variegata]|uniref:Uncharacterized protein n=1 Tax=Bauhinia variegata TaxID=167791 RepID=A0ACB9KH98_BAUVA|nr:hypothetical protein L6164_036529 [Bauhinia variegata]